MLSILYLLTFMRINLHTFETYFSFQFFKIIFFTYILSTWHLISYRKSAFFLFSFYDVLPRVVMSAIPDRKRNKYPYHSVVTKQRQYFHSRFMEPLKSKAQRIIGNADFVSGEVL